MKQHRLEPQARQERVQSLRPLVVTTLILVFCTYSPGRQLLLSPPLVTIKTAGEIRLLRRAEANRGYPVNLRGVVTFKDKDGFFIRDSTAAISVDAPKLVERIEPGNLVDVWGTTVATGFAPVVEANEITVLEPLRLVLPSNQRSNK
jgi:hypothetical protein